MSTDGQLRREEWIGAVQAKLFPKLLGDARFEDGKKLADRFERETGAWRKTDQFKSVIEIGNELAAAECLLNSLDDGDCLAYEPPMVGTKKRMDFLIRSKSGKYEWVEVKTVAPEWVNDEGGWQRYRKIAGAFPKNAKLIVHHEWAGSAISGQAFKARWSFIQRTAEIEARAALIPDALKGPVRLLFCSTGFDWRLDELEDFADFYRTAKPREDDSLRNAMEKYMHDEAITFNRTLAGFHYLERKRVQVSAHDFRLNVAGPPFGR